MLHRKGTLYGTRDLSKRLLKTFNKNYLLSGDYLHLICFHTLNIIIVRFVCNRNFYGLHRKGTIPVVNTCTRNMRLALVCSAVQK